MDLVISLFIHSFTYQIYMLLIISITLAHLSHLLHSHSSTSLKLTIISFGSHKFILHGPVHSSLLSTFYFFSYVIYLLLNLYPISSKQFCVVQPPFTFVKGLGEE